MEYKFSVKNNSGFSLIETFIALSIGALVFLTTMAVVFPGLKSIRTIKQIERLHSEAVFLSNTFGYWIKQSNDISVPNPSILEVTLPDSSVKTISENGGQILIDGAPLTTTNIEITNLNFTELARSVRIEMTLEAQEVNKMLSITTTIAQRN